MIKTNYIITEAKAITSSMDALWLKFKESPAYEDKELRNFLMWIEHEVNKHVFHIKHECGFFDK